MIDILKPSLSIWKYFKSNITSELIVSSIADKIGGYHISYSATILLQDLGLMTKSENINKKGKKILAHYLHEKYHRDTESIIVFEPKETIEMDNNNGK